MFALVAFVFAFSASAETVVIQAAPVPVSLTAKGAAAPMPVSLEKGAAAPYRGLLLHEDRIAVVAWKAESYDRIATEGVAIVRPKFGWTGWTLLVAVALAAGAGGTWTGGRAK